LQQAAGAGTITAMDLVRLRDPETMHVLGLLLQGYLRGALADAGRAARLQRLHGDLWLRAGSMWVTLRFDGQTVEILKGRSAQRRAAIEGEMATLVSLVVSRGLRDWARALPAMATGRMRVAGDPRFLLLLAPLLLSQGASVHP
jgi:ubiquinone biosynthesis protein UbiJ